MVVNIVNAEMESILFILKSLIEIYPVSLADNMYLFWFKTQRPKQTYDPQISQSYLYTLIYLNI